MSSDGNAGPQTTQPRYRILVIEDHPSTLNMLGEILGDAGYEPVLASGGNEGIHLLRREAIDLIVLDLILEDMDGWTVLKTIKMDEDLCLTPVVIVTARTVAQEERSFKSHEGLFEGYVLKPFLIDELLDQVRRALA
jgi:CheY-like chemotaxis protein